MYDTKNMVSPKPLSEKLNYKVKNKFAKLPVKTRVGRFMRENSVCYRLRKKYKETTNSKHNYPVEANLLEQEF